MGSSADSPPKSKGYSEDFAGIVDRAIRNLREAGRKVPIVAPVVR